MEKEVLWSLIARVSLVFLFEVAHYNLDRGFLFLVIIHPVAKKALRVNDQKYRGIQSMS